MNPKASSKKILVTGGAGFIGSHVNLLLTDRGYETIVFDNLSQGDRRAVVAGTFIEGDLGDRTAVEGVFRSHDIVGVMHFAASIDAGESVGSPSKYYRNNVANTLNLLDAMVDHGVENLIFSSTAAVYGSPDQASITEKHGLFPINPYGQSKLMVEQLISDYSTAYSLHCCALRYFNVAGGDPSGRLKNYKTQEHNLIPVALRSILNDTTLTINGTDYPTKDGSCVRDYIHVIDLANGHLLALEKLLNGKPAPCYNLGNGSGFSVKEVISEAEAVTGKTINVKEGPRRPGDPSILIADASRAKQHLGWTPQFPNLNNIIQHAWMMLQH